MARVDASAAFVLLFAVACGLATGVVEVVILLFRKFALHEMIGRSPHFTWMAPLFYVLLFLLSAVPFALVSRWSLLAYKAAVFLLVFVSAASTLILLAYGKLHNVALLVLAIGVAVQGLRMMTQRAPRLRALRRFVVSAGLLVAVMGVSVGAWRVGREQLAKAALPGARADAPNVLLIILDTVRAASLSLYGYSRPTTPELQKFAERGVVFEQAFSTSPWTLPSHGSMFTGLPPHELSANWQTPLNRAPVTLSEIFDDSGYETAGFVANLIFGTAETGLARGFQRYEDFQISPGQVVMNASLGRFVAGRWSLRELIGNDEVLGRKHAARISNDFLSWVGTKRDRPFFAFLNYYDAHDPYLPPDGYYRAMSGHAREHRLSPLRRVPVPQRRNGVSAEALRIERDSYDGALAYIDHEIGGMLRELERRGVLQNTLVVITADHGEEFGEHGLWYHGNSLYLPALQVPLVVVQPGRVPAGVRVQSPVSLVDLAATIQELSGVAGARRVSGQPLSAAWRGQGLSTPVVSSVRKGVRLPDWYPISHADLASVITPTSHYIRSGTGREELFDYRADVAEQRNRASQPGSAPLLEQLRSWLPAGLKH